MRIWIGNMAPGTTDDELKAFVKKYAPELECTEIQRVEDSGTRPGAILQFTGYDGTTGKSRGALARHVLEGTLA